MSSAWLCSALRRSYGRGILLPILFSATRCVKFRLPFGHGACLHTPFPSKMYLSFESHTVRDILFSNPVDLDGVSDLHTRPQSCERCCQLTSKLQRHKPMTVDFRSAEDSTLPDNFRTCHQGSAAHRETFENGWRKEPFIRWVREASLTLFRAWENNSCWTLNRPRLCCLVSAPVTDFILLAPLCCTCYLVDRLKQILLLYIECPALSSAWHMTGVLYIHIACPLNEWFGTCVLR